MVAVQTTYDARIQPGLEGGIASEFDAGGAETRVCETVAGIAFGRAVTEGAGQRGAVLGGATGFIGISIRDITLIPVIGQTVDLYQQKQNMGVKVRGDIWVRPVVAVVHGTVAQYDGTTGQLQPAAAGIAIPGSRWMTDAAGGALAVLRLTSVQPGVALA